MASASGGPSGSGANPPANVYLGQPAMILLAEVPVTEISRQMKCPGCQLLLMSPIYNCEQGHSICSMCVRKVNVCGVDSCRRPFTNSRNIPLECIVNSSRFFCTNRPIGCTVVTTISDLQTHERTCPFRPFKCYLGFHEGCSLRNHGLYTQDDFIHHLLTCHNMSFEDPVVGRCNVFKQKYEFHGWTDNYFQGTFFWKSDMFNFQGNVFIPRVFLRADSIHIKMVFVGADTGAVKYSANIILHESSDEKLQKYDKMNLIPAIADLTESWLFYEPSLPGLVARRNIFERLGRVVPATETSPQKFVWTVWYQITSVQSTNRIF